MGSAGIKCHLFGVVPANDLYGRVIHDATKAGVENTAAQVRILLRTVIARIKSVQAPEDISPDQHEGFRSGLNRNGHFDIVVSKGVFAVPFAEDAAKAGKQSSQHKTDRDLPPRKEKFLTLFTEKTGRENCDIGVSIHIGYHLAKQSKVTMMSNIKLVR